MSVKYLIVSWLVIGSYCFEAIETFEEPFVAASAMTTVLARPLGGYGLTPLVFEPSPISSSSSHPSSVSSASSSLFLEGSSSESVPTKVRKSPVYEVLMPNFEDDSASLHHHHHQHHQPTTTSMPDSKSMKKLDYESLISPKKHTMSLNVVPQPQQNAAEYFNSVLDILKMKDSTHSYNAIAPMPGFKPNLNYGDAHSSSSFFNQQGAMQQDGYGAPAYTAAIQSMRTVEVNDVQDSYENSQPQIIDIPPSAMPIVINFRTSASQIQIHQSHDAGEPKEVQETSSQDEPHFLRHSVTKPVIQEVHEIILPYRRIIQEIRPVEEEIKTIVARGSQGKDGSGHHGGGGNLGPIGPQDLQQLHQSSLSFGSSVHGGAAIGGKLNSGLKGGKLPGYGNKLSTSNGSSSSSASASSKGYKSS